MSGPVLGGEEDRSLRGGVRHGIQGDVALWQLQDYLAQHRRAEGTAFQDLQSKRVAKKFTKFDFKTNELTCSFKVSGHCTICSGKMLAMFITKSEEDGEKVDRGSERDWHTCSQN